MIQHRYVAAGVMEWHFAEREDFEACWDLEKFLQFFEPLEKPSSLNECGSTNGSTRGAERPVRREFIDWL
jgi:hypothetical protein